MADDPDDDVTDDEPGDLDVEVLEDEGLEEADTVFVDDDLVDEEAEGDDEGDDEVEVPQKRAKSRATEPDDDDNGDDDDDQPDPDDVEADLDTILKDRLVVVDDDEEDDDEPVEAEEKGEAAKVRPRAPGEFLCRSCFLVKHPSQLADADALLCRDCV